MTKRIAAALALTAAACTPAPFSAVETALPATTTTEAPPEIVAPTTTTAVATPTTHTHPRASRSRPRPVSVGFGRRGGGGDVWGALARCESGNRNDGGAPFFGFFQFSASTWRSMGHTGTADQYPYDVQLEAAQRLQARSGWGQWPACSRKLGLR